MIRRRDLYNEKNRGSWNDNMYCKGELTTGKGRVTSTSDFQVRKRRHDEGEGGDVFDILEWPNYNIISI